MKKLISIAIALVLLSVMAVTIPVLAAGTEIHVYSGESIQAAVDTAFSGDTIFVHKGEYHESVEIATGNITLEAVGKVILDGMGVDAVGPGFLPGIWLSTGVTGVEITGFEIRNFGAWEGQQIEKLGVGIWMQSGSYGNIITGNKLSNCLIGIMASTSDDNIIEENKLSDGYVGIGVERAGHFNKVIKNKITDHFAGIVVDEGSTFNVIEENNITKSIIAGIVIDGNVENGDSSYNEVIDNRITKSEEYGILLQARSSYNRIKENRVTGSGTCDLYDAGTGNIWEENIYKTSDPDPLP